MNNKETKVKPRVLSGFVELLPGEQLLFNQIYDHIRSVFEKYAFLPLDTPVMELSEVLLAKAGGETEKQIYRFTKGENDLSLRFDLTVPLSRYVAGHWGELTFPFKRYHMARSYRGERPQKGRFREFYQCDIDVVGNEKLDTAYDAEIPAVIYEIFSGLDIGDFIININNRKLLMGFFTSLGIEDAAGVMRIVDKLDKIGIEGVDRELSEAGVSTGSVAKIKSFISQKGSNREIISYLKSLGITDELFAAGVEELETVCELVGCFGVPEKNFKITLSIARGLDYYTGTIYETVLIEHPSIGSVCSGGRYDDLASHYTDKALPGVGMSIGLSRLFAVLLESGTIKPAEVSFAQVLCVPMEREQYAYTAEIAASLRKNGIITDTCYAGKGLKQKMKYADKIHARFAVIMGDEEMTAGTASVKNMTTGEQILMKKNDIADFIKTNLS